MRRRDKEIAEEFLSSLSKAHSEIRRLIWESNWNQAKLLLGQCQEGAVELGNMIERTEGEGCAAVSPLEEYCELVYQLYGSLENSHADAAFRQLEGCIEKSRNRLQNDVKIRLEVVFLPYKASMWDSLESVWRAAEADPDCDAYVVPIPYYERKSDYSFGAYRYEGAEFPADVPITHYTAYSIEERRPDIIYIHNPYDDENYVTTVDPQFYSSELKKWTECLVYIPYFMHGEPKPGNPPHPENITHFILSPGVQNADRVILQSEIIKYCYMTVLLENLGDTDENRTLLEQKLWVLGSPKLDRITAMQLQGVEVPEQWREKIYRPDGSRKRVVFYNTGIRTLLKSDEHWIAKIERILSIYRVHAEETVLLWRPHPLVEAALASMRPGLRDRYLELKEAFLRKGWGIYDESVDVEKTVVLSDAFYGDSSSVSWLFRAVNKPVMVHKIKRNAKKEYAALMAMLDADAPNHVEKTENGRGIYEAVCAEYRT